MLVYKYRGGENEIFQRDLISIEKNFFWSSHIDQLNDPCETQLKFEKFILQTRSMAWLLGKSKSLSLQRLHHALYNVIECNKKLGIYSLSQTYLDELLWAHYAYSHKGFCIEYDLDDLLATIKSQRVFSFAVRYSKQPPEIDFNDVNSINNGLINKLAGFKSKRWEYEKEYRIVTNFSGKHPYMHSALKSIYFGIRMSEEHRDQMFKVLRSRNIKFYQIQHKDKSYTFEAVPIQNPYANETTYLCQIPANITKTDAIPFKILETNYYWINKKGTITIELITKVNKDSIEWLANIIKDEIFHTAERVFIFYYLKYQSKTDVAWATSHIVEGKLEIIINDFVLFRD